MFVFIFRKLFFLLSFALFFKALSDSVLHHSHSLNFGRFYDWEDCHIINSFANAFELKTDVEEKWSDEEGMTGMRLRCANQRDEELVFITSYSNRDGTWKGLRMCPPGEWLTGFRVKNQGYVWWIKDDTAANGVEKKCNHSHVIKGGGKLKGKWTEWNSCKSGEAICSIRTKVEDVHTADRVGFVLFKCCPLIFSDGNETDEFPISTESQVADSSLILKESLHSTSTESPTFTEEFPTPTESQDADLSLISDESISTSTESPSSEFLSSTESQVSDSSLTTNEPLLSTSTETPSSVSEEYSPSDHSSNKPDTTSTSPKPDTTSTTPKPDNSSMREIIFPDTIKSYRKYFTNTQKGGTDKEPLNIIHY